jgi:hypothetical protein
LMFSLSVAVAAVAQMPAAVAAVAELSLVQ